MKNLYPALIYSITYISLLFSGCEYELKEEHYNDIKPPEETKMMSIELSDQSDTILIYNYTNINYQFNADGLTIHLIKFYLGSRSWDLNQATGTLEINPFSLPAGHYQLTVEIYTNSGTGSIGDILGYEGYYAKHSWVVKILEPKAPVLEVFASKTDDGYLKIEWEKNDLPNFVSYEIRFPDRPGIIITDPDKNYYVDTLYTCGQTNYRLVCNVIGGSYYSSEYELVINENTNIHFISKELDSLTIYWHPLKYNCFYTLTWGSTTLLENSSDTSITIPHPGFKYGNFALHIHSDKSPYNCGRFVDYKLEKSGIGTFYSWEKRQYLYNYAEDVIYAFEYDSLVSFNNLYRRINNISLGKYDVNTRSYISSQTASSAIAAMYNDKVFIYNDSQLNLPTEIPVDKNFNYLNFTDNNKLILGRHEIGIYGEQYLNKVVVIDLETETKIFHEFDYNGKIRSSKDGRYLSFIARDSQVVYMYEIQDNSLLLKYSFHHPVSWLTIFEFNDYDPTKFFINSYDDNILEMRSCEDNSIIKWLDYSEKAGIPNEIKYSNIDPVSGYLFIKVNNEVFKVLDMQSGDIKFEIDTEFYIHGNLYNNKIITNQLDLVCIKKYLE